MKTDLTIQSVVRNEPFIYYAIKAVYDYCDEILLYDTGSTDNTLEDIQQLLWEDEHLDKKIKFKQIALDSNEEFWELDKLADFKRLNKDSMSVAKCRQMQIDETKTKYFMLVDGDEVHYKNTMENVTRNLIPNWPQDKIAVGFPLVWFYDIDTTFTDSTFPVNGRLMVTDKVHMDVAEYPTEQHLIKETGQIFTYDHPSYLIYKNCTPYAHFETVIRPWRRKHLVSPENVKPFTERYPEVIYENSYYMSRWMDEQKN